MRRTRLVFGAVMAGLMFAMIGAGAALADTVFSTSDSPTTKKDCKNGGYAKFGFKNQGRCIEAVSLPQVDAPTISDPRNVDMNVNGSHVNGIAASSQYPVCLEVTKPQGTAFATLGPTEVNDTTNRTYSFTIMNNGANVHGWPDGQYYFRAYQCLQDGTRISAFSDSYWGIVDTVKPPLEIVSGPTEGETITADIITVDWRTDFSQGTNVVAAVLVKQVQGGSQGIVGDHGSEYVYGVGPTVDPVTSSNLEDGTYTLHMVAYDRAQNRTDIVRTFTIDTTPPPAEQ
jgi:hypothetical protein